jgi:hypothetical protein
MTNPNMVRPVMVTFWAIEAPEREACGVHSVEEADRRHSMKSKRKKR